MKVPSQLYGALLLLRLLDPRATTYCTFTAPSTKQVTHFPYSYNQTVNPDFPTVHQPPCPINIIDLIGVQETTGDPVCSDSTGTFDPDRCRRSSPWVKALTRFHLHCPSMHDRSIGLSYGFSEIANNPHQSKTQGTPAKSKKGAQ